VGSVVLAAVAGCVVALVGYLVMVLCKRNK